MGEGLLPVFGPVPERILCQADGAGCAACCGLYNFKDRSTDAHHRRLVRRTEKVLAAFEDGRPDEDELCRVRDELLERERPELLSGAIKVCPWAGYLEGIPERAGEGRVGCLLHPLRHPEGEDLRHLAVYPREICEGHFCAPHDWLRPVEQDMAQTARGLLYGRVVTDAGLVKAVRQLLEDNLERPLRSADARKAPGAWQALWRLLLDEWPWADANPRRFGGITITTDEETGEDDVERTLPKAGSVLAEGLPRPLEVLLDAAQTRLDDEAEVRAAAARAREAVAQLARRLASPATTPQSC